MPHAAEFKVNVSKSDWFRVLSSFPGAKADLSVILFIEHVNTSNPAIFRLRARKAQKSDVTTKVHRISSWETMSASKVEDDVQITNLEPESALGGQLPSASLTVKVSDPEFNQILSGSNDIIVQNTAKLIDLFTDDHLRFAKDLLGLTSLSRTDLRLIPFKITEIDFELKEPTLGDINLTYWRWGDEPNRETFEISWKQEFASRDDIPKKKNAFKDWLRGMNITPNDALSKTSAFKKSTLSSAL